VKNTAPVTPTPAASSSQPGGDPGSGALLALVNGGLAGVGSVYIGTHSVLITIIAGVMAIVLALIVLAFRR
jgi:hypothetical protein